MALTASFVADFSSFMDATREAVTAMQGFKQTAEELGPGVDRGLEESLKMYEQVGRQTRQLAIDTVAASKTFINAYAEEQDAVNRLTSSLQAQGLATPEIIAQYSALATQFQNTTKYADEAVVSAEAVLTTIGKVGPENMELALTAVTNLASSMKIDLGQAASIVAKALGSGGDNLGRLNTLLKDSIEPGTSAAEMLQKINDKTGPAAQNEMQTYNGQIANLNNQMSDFQELIGGVLVENLTALLGVFKELPDPVQKLVIGVVAIGTAVAPVLVSLASLVSILATPAIGAGLMTAITAVIGVLTGPVGIVVAVGAVLAAVIYNWDAIVGYTQRLYEGIKQWLVDGFDRIVGWVKDKIAAVTGAFQSMYNLVVGHSIVPDMITGIGQEFGKLDSVMVQPVADATAQVQAHLQLMAAQMRANAILNRNSLFTTSGQLEEVARVFDAASGGGRGGGAGNAAPVTVNNTFNLVDTESNLARRVSDIIMQTIRAGTQLGTA